MIRFRGAAIVAASLLAFLNGSAHADALQGPLATAKTCSAGYTHALIGGEQKCLRTGEFCAHRFDSQYRRYGYRCTHYDSHVARYRLTHR